ncbi:ankyrin repeat domain-containing protein [Alkalihalobacillus pseudalcaliphilus]|uniref:ankyrin repeat domain-containing protein n=1 Tax=Alkalihalobacillus pseudalcaliphilus TaxID=79884 RepID=UPI00064DE37A|nr:ankyrin repeat domain-containing protein [Alkalihalobacillus pseudalcaliphilus]KMK78144.1 hypothetical protein AB990_01510 [Alkalihalobacillus pseudalcaliphilus]
MGNKEITLHKEYVYLSLCLLFTTVLLYLTLLFIPSLLIIVMTFFGILYLFHFVQIGRIRATSIQVTDKQNPQLYRIWQEILTGMKIQKQPDLYIVENKSALQTVIFLLCNQHVVVLSHHDITVDTKELAFVMTREILLLQKRQVWKNIFVIPAFLFPIFPLAYLRAVIYKVDQQALFHTKDFHTARKVLNNLALGPNLISLLTTSTYKDQFKENTYTTVRLYQFFSPQPLLSNRLASLTQYYQSIERDTFQASSHALLKGKPLLFTFYGLIISLTLSISLLYTLTTTKVNSNVPDTNIALSNGITADTPFLLIEAIRQHENDRVRQYLQDDIHLDSVDLDGLSPLNYAAEYGNYDAAYLLLEAGASPHPPSVTAPLIQAYVYEHPNIAQLLLEHGADINITDDNQLMAIGYLVENNQVEMLQVALQDGANPNQLYFDRTPLSAALAHEYYQAAKLLYENGADPTISDGDGQNVYEKFQTDEHGLRDFFNNVDR